MKNTLKNTLATELKALCAQLGLPVGLLSGSVFQIYGEDQTVNLDLVALTCTNVSLGTSHSFEMVGLSSLLQSIYRIDEETYLIGTLGGLYRCFG